MDPDQEHKQTESARTPTATNQLENEDATTPTANSQLAIEYATTPTVEDQIEIEPATEVTLNHQLSKKRQETLIPLLTAPNAMANCVSCASEAGCEACEKYHVSPQYVSLDGDVTSYRKVCGPVASNKECFDLQEDSVYNGCRCSTVDNKECLDLHEVSGYTERRRSAVRNKDISAFVNSARIHHSPAARNKELPDFEDPGHIHCRPAASNKECLNSHEDFQHTEHRRPVRPTNTAVPTSFISLLGHNILQISAKVVWMMQWPFAVLICAFACIYMYKATWRIGGELVSASLQPVCQLPGFYMLPICSIATPATIATPQVIPYADRVIGRAEEIAEIHRFASKHVNRPLSLLEGQSSMKSLMLELAGLDLPNKDMLLKFVKQLNELAEKSIDTMETSLCKTNSLVDNTMVSNAWAKDKLALIEARSHTALAPVYRAAEAIGLSRASAVKDIEATFMQYNDMLHDQAGDVLRHFQLSRRTLNDLEFLILEIINALTQERDKLEHQQLSEASYWKMILRPHAARMRNFEKLAIACAKFCKDLQQANKVVELTSTELIRVRARVKAFQDQLKVKSLVGTGGVTEAASIELTIGRLSASIKYLDEAKQDSRAMQRKLERPDNYGPLM